MTTSVTVEGMCASQRKCVSTLCVSRTRIGISRATQAEASLAHLYLQDTGRRFPMKPSRLKDRDQGAGRKSASILLAAKFGPSANGPVSFIAGGQVRQQKILSPMQIGKSARIGLAAHTQPDSCKIEQRWRGNPSSPLQISACLPQNRVEQKIFSAEGIGAACPQKSLTVHSWFKSCKSLKNSPSLN